jgi:hypothetical protein
MKSLKRYSNRLLSMAKESNNVKATDFIHEDYHYEILLAYHKFELGIVTLYMYAIIANKSYINQTNAKVLTYHVNLEYNSGGTEWFYNKDNIIEACKHYNKLCSNLPKVDPFEEMLKYLSHE